ncbi:MAG TPA: ABC transporter substrate-binding protein [Nannocystaceae bacterium]|nr:ABC transporter substrate-binding protein [Nannocystaceae bacterium]
MTRRTPLSIVLTAVFALPAVAMAGETETETATELAASETSETTAAPAAEEAEPKTTALDTFKKAHETVLLYVRSKVKDDVIQKEVDNLLNYSWIAKTALGGTKGRADKKCEPRCAEFETALGNLIRQNYLKRLHDADQGSVQYLGEEKRARASKVTTKVKFKRDGVDQEIEVAYVMRAENGKWQVVDIITDGVSLVKNYKYEFNQILRDEGIDGLIKRLQTKLDDLAKAQ